MGTFKLVPGHTIKTGNGPADRGGWPYALCECGYSCINKDAGLVLECIGQHLDAVEGITE